MNKIIFYIATSTDGFIADTSGGVDWLPQPKDGDELEIVGYKKLMDRIDTIVMGSKSFKQIIAFGDWAWTDKSTYVFRSQAIESPLKCITITNDDPTKFMQLMMDRKSNKDIWLLGGAQLARSFAEESLIDEIILTIISKRLGNGIALGISLENFDLFSEQELIDGMVQKVYLRKG
jgi:dihydrofolate reductase